MWDEVENHPHDRSGESSQDDEDQELLERGEPPYGVGDHEKQGDRDDDLRKMAQRVLGDPGVGASCDEDDKGQEDEDQYGQIQGGADEDLLRAGENAGQPDPERRYQGHVEKSGV